MNPHKKIKEYIHNKPNIKKIIGITFIILGFLAFITPLTPGSWLFIIGLELLGLRIIFSTKIANLKSSMDVKVVKKFTNYLLRVFALLFLIYFGLGVILFFFQNNYIYYPDKTDMKECQSFNNADKISHNSSRGYYTERSADKIIVYYHGNAGRACDRYFLDQFFAEQNYSTYFVEYSGYAELKDNPSMEKILNNVLDTIEFVKTKTFTSVTIMGESIGVGPAAYHAQQSNIDNLVLITAFNNFSNLASSHYPIYPINMFLRDNYTPDKWLEDYTGPISIILAENDEFIPQKLSLKLYDGIRSNLKEIFTVKNVGHNTIYESNDFYTYLKIAL